MTRPAMTPSARDDYVAFVEVDYFGAMQRGDPDAVLALFAPGATLTGYFGNAPGFVAARSPAPGQRSLDDFMRAARDFNLSYTGFVHVVDLHAERIASHFTLEMMPKPGGPKAAEPARRMRNCNFFQFRRGELIDVVAYFAEAPL